MKLTNKKYYHIRLILEIISISSLLPFYYLYRKNYFDNSGTLLYCAAIYLTITLFLIFSKKKIDFLIIVTSTVIIYILALFISDFQINSNLVFLLLVIIMLTGISLMIFIFNLISNKILKRNIRIASLNTFGLLLFQNKLAYLDIIFSILYPTYFLVFYFCVLKSHM
jgi:hypothetical protein